ncbi:MAG: cyclodeaminase/cyclohydrolase family protein [Phycisphaerales bacterium]|nr:cyclodeaminase/cyclohydrolase family protein [Phycisphaerales bacterium]
MTLPAPTGIAQMGVGAFLGALAARAPAPGGGAAACVAGAVAAAQAEMVVAYSLGKRNLAEHQPRLESARAALAATRTVLLELADEDASAYAELNRLQKLPEGDPARRGEPAAMRRCAEIPAAALAACVNMLRLLADLPGITNRLLRSDLAIAATLADASAGACGWNVRINVSFASGQDWATGIGTEATRELKVAADLAAGVQRACSV